MAETKTKILIVTAVILVTVLVCSSVTVVWWGSIGGLSGLGNSEVKFIRQAPSDPSFTVTVDVDLSDGMNRTEATSVAMGVFSHLMENTSCTIQSATSTTDGIWTVNLSWGWNPQSLNHVFGVQINPSNQTATYSRC